MGKRYPEFAIDPKDIAHIEAIILSSSAFLSTRLRNSSISFM